jgi:hypothetical protein
MPRCWRKGGKFPPFPRPGLAVEDDDLQRAAVEVKPTTLQNFTANNSFAKSLGLAEVLGRGGHLRTALFFTDRRCKFGSCERLDPGGTA